MNGRTAKLIRKVAKKRGAMKPKEIRALKRHWNSLKRSERAAQRKEYQAELEGTL